MDQEPRRFKVTTQLTVQTNLAARPLNDSQMHDGQYYGGDLGTAQLPEL